MFAEAVADELLERNPVVLKRADLPVKLDRDPTRRAGAPVEFLGLFGAAEEADLAAAEVGDGEPASSSPSPRCGS